MAISYQLGLRSAPIRNREQENVKGRISDKCSDDIAKNELDSTQARQEPGYWQKRLLNRH